MELVYRYREAEYGEQLVRLYLLKNDKGSGLGTTPIPDGRIQILRRNDDGGLSFLASRQIKYVPIGDRLELNLGPDPEVIFDLRLTRVSRGNIWLRLQKSNIYKRADDGVMKVEQNADVEGWDEHLQYTQRVRNYTDRPIKIEVRRSFDGDVSFRSGLDAKQHDYRTVEYEREVGKGERAELPYEVLVRNGYNAKQSRVAIEPR